MVLEHCPAWQVKDVSFMASGGNPPGRSMKERRVLSCHAGILTYLVMAPLATELLLEESPMSRPSSVDPIAFRIDPALLHGSMWRL